jgi:hypothetical protein
MGLFAQLAAEASKPSATSFDWPGLAQVVEPVLLALGGVWVFFLYRKSRRGQANVGIETNIRMASRVIEDRPLLLVGTRIRNTSGVLYRNQWAEVRVMDASRLAEDGSAEIATFATQDPFLPVYGTPTDEAEEITAGKSFVYLDEQPIAVEPGEAVDSDLVFPLSEETLPTLLAIRVDVQGFQGRWGRRPWVWSSFTLFDPGGTGSPSA